MTAEPIAVDATALLFSALAKAQAHAQGVGKDKTNSFHKYAYASAEAMIAEAKEALSFAQLAVVPVSSTLREPTAGEIAAGAVSMLVARWMVAHEAGGHIETAFDWPVVPERGRPIDKAVAAARTAALSYLLRDTLQLARVEEGTDLDGDDRDKNGQRTAPKQQQRTQAPEQKTQATTEPTQAELITKTKKAIVAELRRLGTVVLADDADAATKSKAQADAAEAMKQANDGKPPKDLGEFIGVLMKLEKIQRDAAHAA